MIGHLYRYSHPHDPSRFIYVGQGSKRDSRHRLGRTSFGKRFKRSFPNEELPQPVKEIVEVRDQLELNELETIYMFRYHTWRGYGGMNITLPGSDDYKNMGLLGGQISKESGQIQAFAKSGVGGRIAGRIRVESGGLASISTYENRAKGGRVQGAIQGRKNVESGHLFNIRTKEHQSAAGRISGRMNVESGHMDRMRDVNPYNGPHIRWHVRRNIVKKGCKFCEVK